MEWQSERFSKKVGWATAFVAVFLVLGGAPAFAHGDHDGLVLANHTQAGEYYVTVWFPDGPARVGESPISVVAEGSAAVRQVAVIVWDPEEGSSRRTDLIAGESAWTGSIQLANESEHLISVAIQSAKGWTEQPIASYSPFQPSWFWRLAVGMFVLQAVGYARWLWTRRVRTWHTPGWVTVGAN